jgi:DNA repair exonuclease SbcCD ATPase subunit
MSDHVTERGSNPARYHGPECIGGPCRCGYAALEADLKAAQQRIEELERRLVEEAQRGLKNGQARIAAEVEIEQYWRRELQAAQDDRDGFAADLDAAEDEVRRLREEREQLRRDSISLSLMTDHFDRYDALSQVAEMMATALRKAQRPVGPSPNTCPSCGGHLGHAPDCELKTALVRYKDLKDIANL